MGGVIMKKILNNFTIESATTISYFDDIVNFVLKNEKDILDFFKLEKLPQKFNIIIMNYDDFKDVQIKAYGKVIDYVRGITNGSTNTIMILTIEDQLKYTTHKNATLDDTLKMILHEVVHACNSVVAKFYYQTAWLQEGLATNLANQNYSLMDLSECDFELLKNDFMNYGKYNYAFAYTIVNFILNNYDKEIVYKLITDSNYLRDNDNRLFEEAKQHMLNEKLSKR